MEREEIMKRGYKWYAQVPVDPDRPDRDEPRTGAVLYVHLADDCGIFSIDNRGVEQWITQSELLSRLAEIARIGGKVLYSRDNPELEPPGCVRDTFEKLAAMVSDITLSPQPHPSTRREEGVTTLMAAAFTGNLAMVRDLVERRADVNAAESVGYTALMYAANASPR
jgi:hypothetical protein